MNERYQSLPSRLRTCTEAVEINEVPCLLVRKDDQPRPFLFWMHGRTADKELDPGRYLRCVRRGLNVCAVDLPGHGQRFDETLQGRSSLLDIILQMAGEIDGVLAGLETRGGFDLQRCAIGGMSAGGMIAITRLLQPHPFKALVLEATGGSWEPLLDTPFCEELNREAFRSINPVQNLAEWSDIPVIAFHSRHDSWIPYQVESEFIEAIRMKSMNPNNIELISFDRTGAPDEHIGFGSESAFVKETQVEFLARHIMSTQEVLR